MFCLLNDKKIHLFIIILAVMLWHLPFINQAFNIDAPHFICMARQIVNSPTAPYSYYINWHGTVQNGFEIMANPPLFSYYLAGVIALFGEKELPLNASMIFFSIIACFSMYFLGVRFTKSPLFASLLLLATPAYMVNSHTVMADVPCLAFSLLSLACFIYAMDNNRINPLILSGFFIGICSLIKYNGLFLFFIFMLYAVLEKKFFNIKSWIPVLTGLFVFSLWCFVSFKLYGSMHPLMLFMVPGKYTFAHRFMVPIKLICQVVYLGGAAVFPMACLIFTRREAIDRIFFLLALVLAAFVSIFSGVLFGYRWHQALLTLVFLTSGFYFAYLIVKNIIKKARNSDDVFLTLWFFGTIIFNAIFTAVNVRYFLLAVVPAILLFFRLSHGFKARKLFYTSALVITFLVGLMVSLADYIFADAYRSFARNEAQAYKENSNKIWFVGHWGFQYYMEKEGFTALSSEDRAVNKGDKIIAALLPWPQPLGKGITGNMKLVAVLKPESFLPVRVMSREGHANFYSYVNYPVSMGFLPYSFSKSELDTFLIYEVN